MGGGDLPILARERKSKERHFTYWMSGDGRSRRDKNVERTPETDWAGLASSRLG